MKAILGKKIGMTQVFDEEGRLIPVTVIEAGPCTVVDIKTSDKDGYTGVQLGFGFVKEHRLNKTLRGYFKSKGVTPKKYLREFRVKPGEDVKIGDEVKVDVFKSGDYVDVTGTSLGKGFAGSIKRWNFRRGPSSHGSKYHRGSGSLAARDAARVFPGRKLPGHKGSERVTIRNLRVVGVDPEKNLLLVHGGVPGRRGSLVMIKEASR
ncbi:MAG TPA: 50S ribosomal protein L3 [Bacillota bacterium]|nr:50S ribosomal protein L3 [Bacillota bacterium]